MDKQKAKEILIDYQKYRMWQWEYREIWVKPKYRPKEVSEAIDYFINN